INEIMNIDANEYNKSNESQIRDGNELIGKIVAETSDKDYEQIIDIGCGTGNVTRELSRAVNGRPITALDVDPGMIGFAQTSTNRNPNIRYVTQDFGVEWDSLSATVRAMEDSVTLVFTNHCLHLIPDKSNVVTNIGRLLRPNGRLYANIGYNADLYMNLTGNTVETDTEMNVWLNLFRSRGLNVLSKEFCLRDNRYELDAFTKSIDGLKQSLLNNYSDSKRDKLDELFSNVLAKCDKYVDNRTGKTMGVFYWTTTF
ncbi:unnamed protein product, partial [Medioppia subpectinata]